MKIKAIALLAIVTACGFYLIPHFTESIEHNQDNSYTPIPHTEPTNDSRQQNQSWHQVNESKSNVQSQPQSVVQHPVKVLSPIYISGWDAGKLWAQRHVMQSRVDEAAEDIPKPVVPKFISKYMTPDEVKKAERGSVTPGEVAIAKEEIWSNWSTLTVSNRSLVSEWKHTEPSEGQAKRDWMDAFEKGIKSEINIGDYKPAM